MRRLTTEDSQLNNFVLNKFSLVENSTLASVSIFKHVVQFDQNVSLSDVYYVKLLHMKRSILQTV